MVRNLREWRRFPGYSVERRVEVLLSPYLEQALSRRMKSEVKLAVEFPVPKRLFGGDPSDRLHVAADFLCVRRDPRPAWILVELKADVASKRDEQLSAYRAVCERYRMVEVPQAIREAKAGTVHERAYAELVALIEAASRGEESVELCCIEPRCVRAGGRCAGGDGSVPRAVRELRLVS